VPAYTTGCALGFIFAGANSDIFGRRLFLLAGNVFACLGFVVSATASGSQQLIAGLAITGFGGGFCQMAMCSIPELLPNKFRHVGVVLSDGFVFVIVVIGPIVGRYAVESGNDWKFIYWGGFVAQFVSLASLFVWYHPPQHPKGVSWQEGLRGVDYIGTSLIVPGVTLVLVGIIKSVPFFTRNSSRTNKQQHNIQVLIRHYCHYSNGRRFRCAHRFCTVGNV
jgi:MFS family permease